METKKKTTCFNCEKEYVIKLRNRNGTYVKKNAIIKPKQSTWHSERIKYITFYNAWLCNKCSEKVNIDNLFSETLTKVSGVKNLHNPQKKMKRTKK